MVGRRGCESSSCVLEKEIEGEVCERPFMCWDGMTEVRRYLANDTVQSS